MRTNNKTLITNTILLVNLVYMFNIIMISTHFGFQNKLYSHFSQVTLIFIHRYSHILYNVCMLIYGYVCVRVFYCLYVACSVT